MAHDTLPRPAATTLVVRDALPGAAARPGEEQGGSRLEVLMLRRSDAASFMPGSYVFPGGVVDPGDAAPEVLAACDEAPEALRARLGGDPGAPAHAVAALRECFEECGLWLGAAAPLGDDAAAELAALRAQQAEARERLRQTPPDGAASAGPDLAMAALLAVARRHGLPLVTSALQPWSHWVTPIDAPKRFDTRFFVAAAPPGQQASVDAQETTALVWVRPEEALARRDEGELQLEFVTTTLLRELLPCADVAALLAAARRRPPAGPVHPRASRDGQGRRRVLLPGDHAYAEVQRLDPQGSASALSTIEPGRVVMLGATLRRLTAPNPGMMTGPGTNTYLIGRGGRYAVLDPGPAIDRHIDAIVASCAGNVEAVLVTHTHLDHSPAARPLAERCGARLIGLPAPPGTRQDHGFAPREQPADGQWFDVAGCRLQALHTPGHASNHVCWWFPEEHMLFTGDHLMQGSTVVIDPPDGDMAAYLASLRRLPALLPTLAWLAPAHGFLIDRPARAIERLVTHRLAREAKVLEALPGEGGVTTEALVPLVYADVPGGRHGVAARSLLAHLLKLEGDGAVRRENGAGDLRWRRADR